LIAFNCSISCVSLSGSNAGSRFVEDRGRERNDHQQAEAFFDCAEHHQRERWPKLAAGEVSTVFEKRGDAAQLCPAQFAGAVVALAPTSLHGQGPPDLSPAAL
jgi:hypothetical protein